MIRKISYLSPFARQNEDSVDFSALAVYSKILLSHLTKKTRKKILLLAQKEKNEKEYYWNEILVKRIWTRNSLFYILSIFQTIWRSKTPVIHLQQEIYCYGGLFSAYLLIILEILLKLIKKKIIITIHGILPLKTLNKKFIQSYAIKTPLFLVKQGLYLLFHYLSLFSDNIIVHNENIKKLLVTDYHIPEKKIFVIPLPLFDFSAKQIKSKILEKICGSKDKIILFFGFLAPYKGLEILIESMQYFDLKRYHCKLLISGNIPNRFKNDRNYLTWLKKLKKKAEKISHKIVWDQRYIPDQELKNYFERAEIIVIPYIESISSSAPLTLAIKNHLPILASKAFRNIIQNGLLFGSSAEELAQALARFFTNPNYRQRIKKAIQSQLLVWNNKTIAQLTEQRYRALEK